MQRDKALQALGKAQFRKIVTTDPHSYQALRREYGSLNGNGGVPVLHHTEVLEALLRDGALAVESPLAGRLTYHDPCYLGRYGRVFEPPRRVLRALGADLAEMPRNRELAFCCGAGGEGAAGGGTGAGGGGPQRGCYAGGGLPQRPGHVPGRLEDHRSGGGTRCARYR